MDVDTNIENYMVTDLFDLLSLDEKKSSTNEVIDVVNDYIDEFEKNTVITDTKRANMIEFFENIRDTLVFYIENEREEDDDSVELEGQNISDKNVITNADNSRLWEIDENDVFLENKHNEMRDKNIDVPQIRTENIFKGILNPHMKDIVTRIVNIDSQYRQFVVEDEYKKSGDFIIDLSEPLSNVLSLRCYSAQIPYSWYVFDSEIQSNIFYIDNVKIEIEGGNYATLEELCIEINNKILNAGFQNITFLFIKQSGKLRINMDDNHEIIFFGHSELSDKKKNQTMGWIIGFRESKYVNKRDITAEAVADLYGTKYVYVYLDEFNSNRLNNSLVNMSDMPNEIKEHFSAFSRDLDIINGPNGQLIARQENPRKMTNQQRFALNKIFERKSSNNVYEYVTAPTTTNIFTMIPIKKNGLPVGEPIIEFGGSLQSGERVYFGPVNITRLHVKLLDDKGNVMNLNGNDWSFSFLCETLYQRTDIDKNVSKTS
tara:strand:- start:536 stop:1996 length:1461 start_codon:yes stop_codon:yes gene_type:complete